ncbi:hypothetical protein HPB50_001929 [Hyalomma asiaticum]|uniref:Uncharacterized protein n=1 Tax=Hyalomma asiaticum TaxID=266040 RepID=A0ACB7TAM2_HYAAI|nr:hypothetical protein HPB50_001929 [Hyalomma asiaticum]
MWVTLLVENRSASVVLKQYQVEDEAAVELPDYVTTGELLNLIMNEAAVSSEELLKRDSVKVSIPLRIFNKVVLTPLESTSAVHQCSCDE